jgi:hypothetical protein
MNEQEERKINHLVFAHTGDRLKSFNKHFSLQNLPTNPGVVKQLNITITSLPPHLHPDFTSTQISSSYLLHQPFIFLINCSHQLDQK